MMAAQRVTRYGIATVALACAVLCGRVVSGADRVAPRMLVVLLDGTDSARITDAMGHAVPKSSQGPVWDRDDKGTTKRYVLSVILPKDGRYLVHCVGRGAKIELDAGGVGSLGCDSSKEFFAASDSTYEWAIEWRGSKGDTACAVRISPAPKVRPSH